MTRVSQARRRLATAREHSEPTDAPRPIRVAAAIIEKRGRILICRRPVGKPLAGKWEFPGGKIRPSETPVTALARELREELAVEVRIGREIHRMRHRYRHGPAVDVRFYRAALLGLPRNRCFARIAWVRRGDLPRFDFLEGNRALVARLARREIRAFSAWRRV